jgi:uncharacterized membrane protein YphA (DoxX/SURF4 family)
MNIVRRLARPLLAAAFIDIGLSTLRDPGPQVDQLRHLLDRVPDQAHLPADPELLLRIDGALLVGAGTLLALGRMPRLAAVALLAGAAPTTYAEFAYGREKDPEQRRSQRTRLLTRLGLIGGALLAAVDTAGRPGLAWRGGHAVQHVQHSAGEVVGDTASAAQAAGRRARRQARDAARAARAAVPI